MLQKQWEQAFLLVEIKKIPICLIYKVCLLKKYNVKCLLKRNNRRNMEKLCGERKPYWNGGKKGLKFQQGLFQEAQSINNAVMKCNNTVNKYHLTRSVQEPDLFGSWRHLSFWPLFQFSSFLQSSLHRVLPSSCASPLPTSNLVFLLLCPRFPRP